MCWGFLHAHPRRNAFSGKRGRREWCSPCLISIPVRKTQMKGGNLKKKRPNKAKTKTMRKLFLYEHQSQVEKKKKSGTKKKILLVEERRRKKGRGCCKLQWMEEEEEAGGKPARLTHRIPFSLFISFHPLLLLHRLERSYLTFHFFSFTFTGVRKAKVNHKTGCFL